METEVHRLLMAHVQGITTGLPISYPGKQYTPAGDYLRVTHLPNTPTRIGLAGATPLDRLGILQIDLFAMLDRHEIEYIDAAQDIADQFARDTRLAGSGVTVTFVKTWIGPGRADPPYWQVPIFIEYRAN